MLFLRTKTINKFVDVNENFVAEISKIHKISKIEPFNSINKIIMTKSQILIFISEIFLNFHKNYQQFQQIFAVPTHQKQNAYLREYPDDFSLTDFFQ